jgi:hypothetical protein
MLRGQRCIGEKSRAMGKKDKRWDEWWGCARLSDERGGGSILRPKESIFLSLYTLYRKKTGG